MLGEVEPGAPRPKIWLYSGLAALAVIVLAAIFLAGPVYDRFKLWRALQLTEASALALRSNDPNALETARTDAQVALQLWPYDPRVFRQAALVNAVTDEREALPFWVQAWKLSHDPADLREAILAALAANELAFASDQFNLLQSADPNNPLTWLTEARLDLALDEWPEALAAAERVLKTNPIPDDAHFVYAQATQKSPDPAVRAQGVQHLRLLSARTDLLGLRALRDLAGYPGNDPYQITEIARRLEDHPLATRDDKLLALTLRDRLPGADDQAIETSARQLFPATDPDSLVALGHWLMSQHKYSDVLDLIDTQAAFQRRDLFLIRLDAMAIEKQWPAILDLLNRPEPPIEEEIRLLFVARTLTEMGDTERAGLAWERLRLYISNQPAKLLDVGVYAQKLGYDDIAREIYTKLLDDLKQRRQAYAQLIAIERNDHHTTALHDLLVKMAQSYPSDPFVRSDLLYTGFLLGPPADADLETARQLVRQFPSMLSYRITLALGYLRANQPAAALNVFENLPINWSVVNPSWRAIFSAVLRANGDEKDAQTLKDMVPADQLLPEELEILNQPGPALPPSTH
jgi:tetratricopeptide (TPR) repeat protein